MSKFKKSQSVHGTKLKALVLVTNQRILQGEFMSDIKILRIISTFRNGRLVIYTRNIHGVPYKIYIFC